MGRAGLLWVGSAFYPTPAMFVAEAAKVGVCRRIPHVPKGFKAGTTRVLLAHRQVLRDPCAFPVAEPETVWRPGVFMVFRPTGLEQVVAEDVTEEECDRLAARGVAAVVVRRLDAAGTPELPGLGS